MGCSKNEDPFFSHTGKFVFHAGSFHFLSAPPLRMAGFTEAGAEGFFFKEATIKSYPRIFFFKGHRQKIVGLDSYHL